VATGENLPYKATQAGGALEILDPRGVMWRGTYPQLDEVYTVADFIDNAGLMREIEGIDLDVTMGLELMEIPCPKGRVRKVGWPIICFRPVDERKTDISTLVPAPVRRLEDA
jgi:hypothetical protein